MLQPSPATKGDIPSASIIGITTHRGVKTLATPKKSAPAYGLPSADFSASILTPLAPQPERKDSPGPSPLSTVPLVHTKDANIQADNPLTRPTGPATITPSVRHQGHKVVPCFWPTPGPIKVASNKLCPDADYQERIAIHVCREGLLA